MKLIAALGDHAEFHDEVGGRYYVSASQRGDRIDIRYQPGPDQHPATPLAMQAWDSTCFEIGAVR